MEAESVPGEWWLPDNPANRVRGTLEIAHNGSTTLNLIGALRSRADIGSTTVASDGTTTTVVTAGSLEAAGRFTRILGETSRGAFSLLDCFTTHRSGFFSDSGTTERIRVNQAFRGVWLPTDQAEFHSIEFSLTDLVPWVSLSGLSKRYEWPAEQSTTRASISATASVLPTRRCRWPGGGRIELKHSIHDRHSASEEVVLGQTFAFRASRSELQPLEELLRIAGDVQNLVTIGTGRRAALRDVVLYRKDVARKYGGRRHREPIELIAQWQVQPDPAQNPLAAHDLLFSLTDISGMRGLEKWLDTSVLQGRALGRGIVARFADSQFVSDRLMNVAASLEAYDRDKHNDGGKRSYAQRLARCIALAGQPFEDLVSDTTAWTRAMKAARNDVAHHNPMTSTPTTEHLMLSRSGYYLLVMCALRDAGTPSAAFARLTGNSDFTWLAEEHRKMFP